MGVILILANDNTTIYHFRRELLRELIRLGHSVIVALPPHERNRMFVDMGCAVKEIAISRSGTNPFQEFRLIGKYKRLMKNTGPNVVLTYTAKPNIYGGIAARQLGIPYIVNVTGLGSAMQRESILKKIMLFLQKKAYARAETVFFQNGANRAYFESKGIKGNRTHTLPGSGVNLGLHRFETYPDREQPIKFAFVSRIRRDKGFEELFEAVKTLCHKYDFLEFHIAGWYEDHTYKNKIDVMTAGYPVSYHGPISPEDVHALLAECHCLVHPSHHEGMANTVLEASASGRPCLVSDIPGCREAVENGVTGLLFRARDAASLTEMLERFIALPYTEKARMGRAARQKMESEFDRCFVIDAYMNEIDAIINSKGRQYVTL